MNSPKKKKQDVRPSPTRGSARAENDLFTKAMLEEINAYISDTSRNDKQKTMKYILDRNYCCAQFSNENYIKMFHTMFGNNIEEYPIPDIEQIANFNGQSSLKIPDCINNTFNSDGSQPKCTCGFHDGKQKKQTPR